MPAAGTHHGLPPAPHDLDACYERFLLAVFGETYDQRAVRHVLARRRLLRARERERLQAVAAAVVWPLLEPGYLARIRALPRDAQRFPPPWLRATV